MRDATPVRITIICTANRFRSPVAAAAIGRLLPAQLASVDSAAARGVGGLPAVGSVVDRMALHGFDLARHRSQRLEPGALADRDLLLVFEAPHAAAAIADAGARRERTFLFGELLEMLPVPEEVGGPRTPYEVRTLVSQLGRQRVEDFFAPRHQFADPMLGSKRRHAEAVDEVVELASRCAARLFGLPEVTEPIAKRRRRPLRRWSV